MWNTLKQPEIRPVRHAFDTPQKRSGSGVSRCSLWYIYKSCYRPPGVVRRWNQHGLWGVGLLVGLDGFESLDRDGGAGAAGEFTTEADADARSRVSKPSRARNAVERRFRRRSGAVGLAGFGGARAGRPQAPRPRQRPAACAVDRRPPGPGPERPVPRLPRRMDDEGEAREKGDTGAGCSYGMTVEYLLTVRTRCANGPAGRVLDARKALLRLTP